MPYRYSRKRIRDAARIARWQGYDEAVFQRIGVPRQTLESLQAKFQGHFVVPGDPDYDKDRKLFNPVFDPRPLLIAYCAVESDVALCLDMARPNPAGPALNFAVRSGGHSTAGYSGYCDNGLMIDVSGLDDVHVDRAAMTVTVGCGCTFAKLNSKLAADSLHVPGGECDDVCVGGYMQGGGYGFTSRSFGMNCDNVIALRVMLADGRIIEASETTNYDLWWAMRGGTGGNFGVLLNVTYRLRSIGTVWGWSVTWPLESPRDRANASKGLLALQYGYMRTTRTAEVNPQAMICYQSDSNDPEGGDLRPWLIVRGMHLGSEESGRAALAPLLATPGAQFQYGMYGAYVAINDALLGYPQDIPPVPIKSRGMPNEGKAARYVARDLAAEEWLAILDYFVTTPSQWSYMCLELYGAAINRYPVEDSAFIHRDVAFSAFLDVFWYDDMPPGPVEDFLAGWCELMQLYWNGHIYQNYPSANVPDYRFNYWGPALFPLIKVKNKYDPGGLFTFPQQVSAYPDRAAADVELPQRLARALATPISHAPAIGDARTVA
ncbi:MAG TPA: FAD-binding protein [Alphaproteobacteria bacterium]|nr:FAD-binding protein [Alphaproteobacteria bacterium]